MDLAAAHELLGHFEFRHVTYAVVLHNPGFSDGDGVLLIGHRIEEGLFRQTRRPFYTLSGHN